MQFNITKTNLMNSFLILTISLISFFASAQEFNFKFSHKDQIWTHPVTAETWTAALDKASQDCLNHFTNSQGTQKITVDEATADILLNTCTNPR